MSMSTEQWTGSILHGNDQNRGQEDDCVGGLCLWMTGATPRQQLVLGRHTRRGEYHIGGNSPSRCSKIRKYTLGEGRAFRKMYCILKLEETWRSVFANIGLL